MKKCVVKLTDKFYNSVAGTIAKLYKDTKKGNVEGIEEYKVLNNPSLCQVENSIIENAAIIREQNNDPVTAFVYSENKLKYAYILSYNDQDGFEYHLPKIKKLDIDSIKTIIKADKQGIPMDLIRFDEEEDLENKHDNGRIFKVVAHHSLQTYQIGMFASKAFMVIGFIGLIILLLIKYKIINMTDDAESVIEALTTEIALLYIPSGLTAYFLAKSRLKEGIKVLSKK